MSSEEELNALIDRRGRGPVPSDDTPAQIKADALDRWQDEGGAQSSDEEMSAKADQQTSWRGQSIGATIRLGAVIFIGSEDQCAGSVPKVSDCVILAVSGESWRYEVATATVGQMDIRSSVHSMTLARAGAEHPAHGELVSGIADPSVWIIAAVVGEYS